MTTPCQKTPRALSPMQKTPIPTNAAAHLCIEYVRTKKAAAPITASAAVAPTWIQAPSGSMTSGAAKATPLTIAATAESVAMTAATCPRLLGTR